MSKKLYLGVLLRHLVSHLVRVINRAIITDKDFNTDLDILPKDREQCSFDIRARIIGRNNDAYHVTLSNR